jgi:hypothetical protein
MRQVKTIYGSGVLVGKFENSNTYLVQVHWEGLKLPPQDGDPEIENQIKDFLANRRGKTMNLEIKESEILKNETI